MNSRQRFIDYVKKGYEKPYISLQIGAGAGFDCKLASKEWISSGTVQDTIDAYQQVGCDPLINISIPDPGLAVPQLKWTEEKEDHPSLKIINKTLETPFGKLEYKIAEHIKSGFTPLSYPLTIDSDNIFETINWYSENFALFSEHVKDLLEPSIKKYNPHGAVSVQWNIQPFELFGLLSVQDLAVLALLEKDAYRQTCQNIIQANKKVIKQVLAAGADFVFLGGPGVELISPDIYEQYLVPDSKIITDYVHQLGGMIYCHICSPIEPLLSRGYFNQMGLDLFETLSPPPVGNVPDIAEARKILNPEICTRGNLGLDILLNGSEQDIQKATIDIIEKTKGTKHIIAASDYLFYDIPLNNVKAMIRTVNEYQ